MKIAVIGAGIAGISAAHKLSPQHQVVLYERNHYLGGHTNSITVAHGSEAGLVIDTGFIVCNPRNYPQFYRFLDELGVARRDTEMSFGYLDEETGLCYRGPGWQEFIRYPWSLGSPGFLKLVAEMRRFHRQALHDRQEQSIGRQTLGDYVRRYGMSAAFVSHYLVPLAAAIWSAAELDIERFPAQMFLDFFHNHGMLELSKRPQWQTIVGGSRAYVDRFLSRFQGTVRLQAKIATVERASDGVIIRHQSGDTERYDKVVIAAHADESLALLKDPSADERRLLGAWAYQRNHAVLHTDTRLMPRQRGVWSAWNYVRLGHGQSTGGVGVTYWMNRLQGLTTKQSYFVTLNQTAAIDPKQILYETWYTHPIYTLDSGATQLELSVLQGVRHTYYCGSYFGYGFHEDAASSGFNVAGLLA